LRYLTKEIADSLGRARSRPEIPIVTYGLQRFR
jgi:hypothetical protein